MLYAGCAKIEITPKIGSLMSCFPISGNPRRADDIHDPLYARAVVISDADEMVCLCSCDLTTMHDFDIHKIREKVKSLEPDIDINNCNVAGTHTHSSGDSTYLFGNNPDDPWMEEVRNKIASIIIEAFRNKVPVKIGYAKMKFKQNFNRRIIGEKGRSVMKLEYIEGITDGPTDPDLNIVKFEKGDGSVLATLINYTAHALTVGKKNLKYTADYPGAVCKYVESQFKNSTALFFNGAAGNVHPKQCMREDFQIMESFGRDIGDNASQLAEKVDFVKEPQILTASEILTFPNRVDKNLTVRIELNCFRIGPIIFSIVPGEYYVEFQLDFKKHFSDYPVVFIGYANNWGGYIPTLASYDEGGYGVDLFTTDPPEYSRTSVPPGAGEKIYDTMVKLTESILR